MTQKHFDCDAVIVGSGPNGLAAAITLAKAGLTVRVIEGSETIGGGVRSAAVTLPGFTHDICSAVYPMAAASPFFRDLSLESFGLRWIQPAAALAHPLDDGDVAMLSGLGVPIADLGADTDAWRSLFHHWEKCGVDLFNDMLRPLGSFPQHPIAMAHFGINAARSARVLADAKFRSPKSKALFAGIAAHSSLPFDQAFSSATALALGLAAHVVGWPIAAAGAQKISDALANYFTSLGGQIELSHPVTSLTEIPKARVVMLDLSARQFARLCENELPQSYRDRLNAFRSAPGVFKIDWALSDPVPWKNSDVSRAGTVHIGGTFDEIAAGEKAVSEGRVPEKPYVLVSQPSLFDSTRAPSGKHTLWAYCHVPSGSTIDMTVAIENQIERFAPGFRQCILAKHTMTTAAFEKYNPNYVGGDISGGAMDWPQIFRRPVTWFNPYRTPLAGVYLCSASTPPGTGVHGMCGYWAAKSALAALSPI